MLSGFPFSKSIVFVGFVFYVLPNGKEFYLSGSKSKVYVVKKLCFCCFFLLHISVVINCS